MKLSVTKIQDEPNGGINGVIQLNFVNRFTNLSLFNKVTIYSRNYCHKSVAL